MWYGVGLTQHRLNPCLWMSYRSNGQLYGIPGVHVDDLIGAGASGGPQESHPKSFAERMQGLSRRLTFSRWRASNPLTICGMTVWLDLETSEGPSRKGASRKI